MLRVDPAPSLALRPKQTPAKQAARNKATRA
jgi:hypothetical protein